MNNSDEFSKLEHLLTRIENRLIEIEQKISYNLNHDKISHTKITPHVGNSESKESSDSDKGTLGV